MRIIGNCLLVLLCAMRVFAGTTCNSSSSVTQERFDSARSGITANETEITRSNVASSFHRVTQFQTTDNIWAQPLVCDTGSVRILVVADAGANVYGFDADATGTPSPLWTVNLGSPYASCAGDFAPLNNCGIISTPVINPGTGVVYIEAQLSDGSHHLFALNVADGSSYCPSVVINPTDSLSGISFSARAGQQRSRMGLLLLNGTLYAGYASTGDNHVVGWYGWVLGFDPSTLALTKQYCNTCSTPGGGAGFWGSLTSDGTDVFVTSGNSNTEAAANYNPGVYHLSGSDLSVLDWFAPANYATLTTDDRDVDSNVVLFPPSNPQYAIAGGKEGRVYVLNKATGAMGQLEGGTGNPPLFQAWISDYIHGLYRNSLLATATTLYTGGSGNDPVQAYTWNGTAFSGTTTSTANVLNSTVRSQVSFGFSGAQLAYSWDGVNTGSGILWAMGNGSGAYPAGYDPVAGFLCAFHPTTLATLFCSTSQSGDALGNSPKLSSMAIANGHVYVPTRSGMVVSYGLTGQSQTITFGAPTSVTYGNSPVTLTASASSGLTVTYSSNSTPVCTVSGAVLTVVSAGTCSVTASQAGNVVYAAATPVTVSFTISRVNASVTPNAASATYGAADPTFSGTLTGFLAGDGVTASYTRTAGTTVAGSPYTISATLSPSAALANYNITYNTAPFTINPANASVTPNAASTIYGQADPALTGTLSGFLPADGVTAAYTRNAGQTAGTYTISATLSPSGILANYNVTYNTATFTISKATPTLAWPAPAALTFGSALGNGQLDATANVPGTFVYNPPAGTVLSQSAGQMLNVTFTPADSVDYNGATGSTFIMISPPATLRANLVVTSVLRRSGGNVVATLTIANSGGAAASNVILSSVKVGSLTATPLPQSLGTIAAGSSVQATVTVPGTVGASGAASSLSESGSYAGALFSSSARVSLP